MMDLLYELVFRLIDKLGHYIRGVLILQKEDGIAKIVGHRPSNVPEILLGLVVLSEHMG